MSDDEVNVDDLVSALDDTTEHGDLKRLAAHSVEPLRETSQVDQKRANLKAANEIVTEEIDQWAPVVNNIMKRRTVTFENNNSNIKMDTVNLGQNDFGSEIDAILKEEKLTRESQLSLENDALSHLPEEEFRQRIEQLAMMRNLQFYNEQKAKRWKKIKSKQFRRLHKKDMADLPLEELAEVDPEAFKRRLEKIEVDRARERATLRHKNTSQWVRRVLSRGLKAASSDVLKSYEEQVKLGEELSKKINGLGLDNSDDESDDDDKSKIPENPIKENNHLKPLFDMQFMKEAEERKEKELEEYTKMMEGDETVDQEVPASGIVTVRSNQGFQMKKQKESPEKINDKSENIKAQSTDNAEKASEESQTQIKDKSDQVSNNSEENKQNDDNPWLSNKKKRRGNRFISANSINQVTESELKAAAENIDLARKEEQKDILADMFGLKEEFEKEKEQQALKETERVLPNMDELHMEGWGSWAGPGAEESEGARRRRERIEAEREKIKQEIIQGRKDSQYPHVILRDGVDPAVEKYSITDVPKMYSNPKQYSSQLKYPLGPEFNSATGFQKLNRPEMIAQSGTVIDPISFTKYMKLKERNQRRKGQRRALEDTKKKTV